jgi:hypothetical protein
MLYSKKGMTAPLPIKTDNDNDWIEVEDCTLPFVLGKQHMWSANTGWVQVDVAPSADPYVWDWSQNTWIKIETTETTSTESISTESISTESTSN